ncbi:hypothetical protein AVEN_270730-1 [Araneus ventricosus]|uniref:Uncharacterized protein n=1 Tax=Araneus ventricosus TaxID=182803 RepID=A0A4Y2BHC8_ARAVE|nr:hypothetical protein AVEN_270730-1 [Araneus ventricosus]
MELSKYPVNRLLPRRRRVQVPRTEVSRSSLSHPREGTGHHHWAGAGAILPPAKLKGQATGCPPVAENSSPESARLMHNRE